jgi:hypothetical protein
MPCALCQDNNVVRNYTHARTRRHRKLAYFRALNSGG